ncbi:MAG TPA: YunC family protein [Methanoregulaceae archaeon]|nr:YunC family protein [Methanoregulaceae archaeon]
MQEEEILVGGRTARAWVVPAGPVNLVFAIGARGLLGCGAIDPGAFQRFDYPAARVRSTTGPSVRTVEDLLDGEVTEANGAAQALGVTVGISGRTALSRFA